MIKRVIKRKVIISLLAISMSSVMITGCGKTQEPVDVVDSIVIEETDNEVLDTNEENTSSNEENTSSDEITNNGIKYIKTLKNNYASSYSDEIYNKKLSNLPVNYVFEFDCSDKAGELAYKAFKVYDNSKFNDITSKNYNKNIYDNGKITVAPNDVIQLDSKGSRDINNGTWGSLSVLYLVQYIDLETGEDLAQPIVTPFNIQHEIESPIISQDIDRNNNYILKWKDVPGATKYVIFEYSGESLYEVVCTTTDTQISVEEFSNQKKSENYESLIEQDLINAGYKVDKDGITFMNRAVKYDNELNNGYFTVVAVDSNGNTSGISNIVDVRDIAKRLPYTIKQPVLNLNISSVVEIPAYVDVEMIDGSTTQMVINYHGAQTYLYPDNETKMSIEASVANTLFNQFIITLNGMTYDDIMSNIGYVTAREDDILNKVSTDKIEININDGTDTSIIKDIDINTEDLIGTEVETIIQEENGEDNSGEEISKSVALLIAVANEIQPIIEKIGQDKIDKVVYGSTDIEVWIATCLIAQSEIIPLPSEIFNNANNMDYIISVFMEAYRQNPTCGAISDIEYDEEYEAVLVKYCEDTNVRLNKTIQELNRASEIASSITDDSMIDYEKVLAINDYFTLNCVYDYESAETDVDLTNLSDRFLDSHVPYGILCNNIGVCESYSEAFVLTARFAGLDAICETGTLYGGLHEWNRVNVDGSWCILDITNNDQNDIANALFNVSDSQVNNILVSDEEAIVNTEFIRATDKTKEYYYINGKSTENQDEAIDLLAEQLNSSNKALLRLPTGCSSEQIQHIITKIVNDRNIELKEAYIKFGVICLER